MPSPYRNFTSTDDWQQVQHNDSQHAVRLDLALLDRGLSDSRSKAQRLIVQGKVSVNGVVVSKASAKVSDDDVIAADRGDDYVSRGAYKLVGAFDLFFKDGLRPPKGLRCLDIGASTGGFCDVRIANDEHVIEMSGVNIRDVEVGDLPFRPEMIVSDVSFISLTYVIPVIARIAADDAQIVLLVKPQFEVGKGNLGKNGIVESEELREQALRNVIACAKSNGLDVRATGLSPIEGVHGNVEYLLYAVK